MQRIFKNKILKNQALGELTSSISYHNRGNSLLKIYTAASSITFSTLFCN